MKPLFQIFAGLALFASQYALAQGPPAAPDCTILFPQGASQWTSAPQTTASWDNRQTGCSLWNFVVASNGFTAVQVTLQSAPDTGIGPGTWGTFSGQDVILGANPFIGSSAGAAGGQWIIGYQPWIRVSFDSATGTGSVTGAAYGWKTPSPGSATNLSLTTTGTSGAATLIANVLNIPQYQGALTLTTTGTSGASTLIGNTLNVPIYAAGVSSVSGTANQITVVNPTTTPVVSLPSTLIAPGSLTTTSFADVNQSYLAIEVPNDGTSGTQQNKLAKIASGKAVLITTSASDTTQVVGCVKSATATTGNAQIAIAGQLSCLFDNVATTQGDYVVASTATAGTLSDAGSTYPSTGEVMGTVQSTNAACGSPPCGPYSVVFMTPDVVASGSGGGGGGSGGSSSFSRIRTGTNTQATMTVGTGATVTVSGSGVNNANQVNGGTFPASAASLGTNASNQVVANSLGLGASFSNSGNAVTVGTNVFRPALVSCTLKGYWVNTDAGTITFDVWKIASGGSTYPTVANTIISGSSYLSVSTNNFNWQPTSTTPFTTTAVTVGDWLGFHIQSLTGSPTQPAVGLICQ